MIIIFTFVNFIVCYSLILFYLILKYEYLLITYLNDNEYKDIYKTHYKGKISKAFKKIVEANGKEYVTIEADSMDDLLSKVQSYSYNNAANRVMTDAERAVGSHFDFRG